MFCSLLQQCFISESTSAAQWKRSQNSSLLFSNSCFESLKADWFYAKYVSCLHFYLSSCEEYIRASHFSGEVSLFASKQTVLNVTVIYIIILSRKCSLGMEDERSKLRVCLQVVFLMLFSHQWSQSVKEVSAQEVCYEIGGLSAQIPVLTWASKETH